MNIHVHVHLHDDKKVDLILNKLNQVLAKEAILMTDLTTLQASVEKTTTAEQSAIVLLQGLKASLDAAGTDPVALQAISDTLGSNADALAAAVVANTPSV